MRALTSGSRVLKLGLVALGLGIGLYCLFWYLSGPEKSISGGTQNDGDTFPEKRQIPSQPEFDTLTADSGLTPATNPAKPPQITEIRDSLREGRVDVGDSYLTQNGPRKLYRLAGALSVKAEDDTTPEVFETKLRNAGGILANYTAGRDLGGGFQFLEANDAERNRQIADPNRINMAVEAARNAEWLDSANPVFVEPESDLEWVLTEQIIVRLSKEIDPQTYFGANWDQAELLPGTTDQFTLTLPAVESETIFAEVNQRAADAQVVWAEPNFRVQIRKLAAPNDPLYGNQWHLNNTGQGGGTADADADVLEAWNFTTGSTDVVIAVIDDGVQVGHPDLDIFVNSNDPVNGTDDDGNGFIDDINGWDFFNGDNDPNPVNYGDPNIDDDDHGTAVSGVAGAIGGNNAGVTGASQQAKILPVKLLGNAGIPFTTIANSIRYSAGLTGSGWRGADVINMSIGYGQFQLSDDALADAATLGRGGKGCAIFAATGNDADAYQYTGINVGIGSWIFEWRYTKNASGSAGSDTAWLADIFLPDGTDERFDTAGLPAGWSVGGNNGWSIEDDPGHAYGVGRYQARAGTINHGQTSILRSRTVTVTTQTPLIYAAWLSSEPNDELALYASFDNASSFLGPFLQQSGNAFVNQSVGYPASNANTIAVGASTDFDYRSAYSQFGPELDFVAPSNGGRSGIHTTDQTGANGYDGGDYAPSFGGTSSATPLTSGVAALMLAVNPDLTAAEIRSILRDTADEIGGVSYPTDRNDYYGHGRINAYEAVREAFPDGFTIEESGGSTDVVEGGSTDSYTLRLSSPPTHNVVVTISTGCRFECLANQSDFHPCKLGHFPNSYGDGTK